MDAAFTPLERPAGRHRATPRAQELAATVA